MLHMNVLGMFGENSLAYGLNIHMDTFTDVSSYTSYLQSI